MNPEELLEIAERIVGWGRDGEQIEAVVGHSQETEVRVYEGEIESLSVAESQGVGIRVIADNRQGFAHAGTLDTDGFGGDPGRGPRQRRVRLPRRVLRPGRARRSGRPPTSTSTARPFWGSAPRPRSTWPWSWNEPCWPAIPASWEWSRPTTATP